MHVYEQWEYSPVREQFLFKKPKGWLWFGGSGCMDCWCRGRSCGCQFGTASPYGIFGIYGIYGIYGRDCGSSSLMPGDFTSWFYPAVPDGSWLQQFSNSKQWPTGLKVAGHHHLPLSRVSLKPTHCNNGKIPVVNSKCSYSQFGVVEIVEL